MQDTLRKHTVWQVAHMDPDMGCVLEWFASEKQAAQHVRILEDRKAGKPITKHVMHIPQSRAGLVRWLNTHFETDNG